MEENISLISPCDVRSACGRAEDLFNQEAYSCSEAVFSAINEYAGSPLPEQFVRIATGFRGGMGGSGDVCGTLSGAVMALGLILGNEPPRRPHSGVIGGGVPPAGAMHRTHGLDPLPRTDRRIRRSQRPPPQRMLFENRGGCGSGFVRYFEGLSARLRPVRC